MKSLHARWKINPKEVCKIINSQVDPKDLCFRHDTFVSTTHHCKSYLTDKCFDHVKNIEKMFLPKHPVHNPADASWITDLVQSLEIHKLEKNKLLLESYFAYCLNTVSERNIQTLHKLITGRSTSLGYGGMSRHISECLAH